MIDYVYNAIKYISKQLNNKPQNNNQNFIWLLYGDEGIGKSSIANRFANSQKGVLLYKCNNEFELAYNVTQLLIVEKYNRYSNLYEPLIEKIKSEKINTLIFDIEGNVSVDYFDLIFKFFESINQQQYLLDIILFMDSNIYYRYQNIFIKQKKLIYLKPLKKWENKDFIQLCEELYGELEIEIINLVASYSFGNAGAFLQHLNILKFYNIFKFEKGSWCFLKETNINTLLKENFSEIVKKKYELLEPSLQTIIKQTSTIGYKYKKSDLSEVFNVENATSVLKQIEIITELLYFTDAKLENGKFDSVTVQKQIEKNIDTKHHNEWCLALAQYYESKLDICNPISVETYEYTKKCIFYYEKAKELTKIIYHVIFLIPLLCSLNLYNSALDASQKLKKVTEKKIEYIHFYQYSFYLLAQINRELSNYIEALDNLKKYIKFTGIGNQNIELNYLIAELLYGTGDTPKAYDILKLLYNELNTIDDPLVRMKIVSLLSSVEETMNDHHYIKHYNEALSICINNYMFKDYYTLLRKANMAHDGKSSIMLMRMGEQYFKSCNDIVELIMIKHNIGTECIFYDETYKNSKEELEYAYEAACKCAFNQLSYIINSLAILDILDGKYVSAKKKISNILNYEHEDFTLLALHLNKATCLLKLCQIKEAIKALEKAKNINQKKQNRFPFFNSQIILMESYIYLKQHEPLRAYYKLCQYFNSGFLDRSTGILSAKIVLSLLCKKYHYPYPKTLTKLSDNCDAIALKMATNHLVLCDLMFWE